MKRQRGRNRNNNSNKNHNGNRQMESNGPDTKVRGSASQIHDKYVNMAQDASVSGNRVKAESCRQHAEHYLRLMNAQEAAKQVADAAREARQENSRSDMGRHNTQNAEAAREDQKEDKPHEKKTRRYPPRVRKSGNDSDVTSPKSSSDIDVKNPAASNDSDTSSKAALEVIKPKRKRVTKPASLTETGSEAEAATPKRRRKAPARAKTETDTVAAAE